MGWILMKEQRFVLALALMLPISIVAVWWQTRDTRGKRVAFEFPYLVRVPWLWHATFHDEHVLVLNHKDATLVLMRVPGNNQAALTRFLDERMPHLALVPDPVALHVWTVTTDAMTGTIHMLGPGAFVLQTGGEVELRAELDRDLRASRLRTFGEKPQRWLLAKTPGDRRFLPPSAHVA